MPIATERTGRRRIQGSAGPDQDRITGPLGRRVQCQPRKTALVIQLDVAYMAL